MDPFPRQQRLAALRQKLAALTTELVDTEEELGYKVEMPQSEDAPWFGDRPAESRRTKWTHQNGHAHTEAR